MIFSTGEIAIKALLAGRAKRAIERATDLRRNAKRAAFILGNEHHLNAVAGAHIQQPLAGAVPGFLCGHQFRRGNHRHRRQFFAQRFGQVGHRLEIGFAFLVNPAEQLGRAKALLAELFAKGSQAFQIVVKKVGGHRSVRHLESPHTSDDPDEG